MPLGAVLINLFANPEEAAPAGFPQLVGSVLTQGFSTASTSHSVNLPATVTSGNLLLIFFTIGNASDSTAFTPPSGWTALFDTEAQTARGACFAKVAAGTEGGTSVSVTNTDSETATAQVMQISDWYGSLSGITTGTPANTTSAAPDPPSVTASWGSAKNLFIISVHASDDDQNLTAAPTNYTGLTSVISGGGNNNGGSTGTARRELEAATDDPGTGTLQSSEGWVANTIVIRPAA